MSSSPSPLCTAHGLPGQVPGRSGNAPIRILIAAQTTFRECLGVFLQAQRGLTVVGETSDIETTLALAKELIPDLLLIDASMSISSGKSVIRNLRQWNSDIRVMILASSSTDSDTIRAFQLSADGVVLKSDSTDVLLESIRRMTAGDHSMEKDRVADLVRASGVQSLKKSQPNRFGLTAREEEVIIFVLAGYPNAKIAKRLAVSEQTVKHHLTHIFDKLGVYSRVQLALFAVNHHLCNGNDEMRPGSVN